MVWVNGWLAFFSSLFAYFFFFFFFTTQWMIFGMGVDGGLF